MNKKELIDLTAASVGLTKAQAEVAVNTMFGAIADAVKKGEDVAVFGFGGFKLKEKPARNGVNPKSGEKITIAASKTVRFVPAKALKDALV